MTAISQRAFSGGEITSSLYARTDVEKYVSALRTCRNFMVMRHGGATNRPGTTFINEVKDSTKKVRLIPFIFNSEQTYVLEFGEQYIRVYRNGAIVTVSGVSAWQDSHGYVVGDLASYSGTNYYCIQAHTSVLATNRPGTGTSWQDYWYALTGDIYEIPTDYLEDDLATLNYDQSADVVTITHPSYPTAELARTGHTAWTLTDISFIPGIDAPGNLAVSGSSGTADQWVVTSIDEESFEESLPTSPVGSDTVASSGSPRTLSWDAVTGAGEYNVYKLYNGVYGFIGIAGSNSFIDDGIDPDTSEAPPTERNPFDGADNYPSTSTYHQQRHCYGNTNNKPENVECSRSGAYKNFTRRSPLQDDDAVSFTLASNQVNAIKHLRTIGKLIAFTSGGEWVIKGDESGIIKAGAVNAEQISYHGSGNLPPLIIGSSALYVQARGSLVRDFISDAVDGYSSDDLTIYSAHLFDSYTIVDWAYQQIPHSIVWAVRSDGVLLGFTYIRKQQMYAWHRHDTDGSFENCCVVPEGNEDFLYLVVNRTIDGSTVRYIERMNTRKISDIEDLIIMDCALSYDGTNTGSITMTLSGGTGWTYDETLTLTASSAFFSAGDVGNEIHITGADGTIIRASITAYTSDTVVSVKPNKTVPEDMRDTAFTTWGKAVDTISGLGHLEGKDIAVFADGFVEASPNNSAYATITVDSGAATLSKCYVVIHAGLPITSDIETLDIDTVDGETLADKKKLINKLNLFVENTRGLFAGSKIPSDDDDDPLEGLYEIKARNSEGYDDPVSLKTEVLEINLEAGWNSNGRVFIRQVDPLPATILSIVPSGYIPFRR